MFSLSFLSSQQGYLNSICLLTSVYQAHILWQKLIKLSRVRWMQSANKYFKKYLTSRAWYSDVIDAFMPTKSFDMIDKKGEGGPSFQCKCAKVCVHNMNNQYAIFLILSWIVPYIIYAHQVVWYDRQKRGLLFNTYVPKYAYA